MPKLDYLFFDTPCIMNLGGGGCGGGTRYLIIIEPGYATVCGKVRKDVDFMIDFLGKAFC